MRALTVLLALLFSINLAFCQELKTTGLASYYGKQFHGRKTASGEKFDMNSFTSAHRTLPFNTLIKVTNIRNGKSIVVRVNDRGPAMKKRIVDLSYAAAEEIGLVHSGIAQVKIEVLNSASIVKTSKPLKECGFSEIEVINPLYKFDITGKKISTDGGSIEKMSSNFVFSNKYAQDSLSKIKITPIFNSSTALVVNSSKGRKRN